MPIIASNLSSSNQSSTASSLVKEGPASSSPSAIQEPFPSKVSCKELSTSQENKKSIMDLPPEIIEIILEKIDDNEEIHNSELSGPTGLQKLGLAFVTKFFLHPHPAQQVYDALIKVFINEKKFSEVLFYAVLNYFIKVKGLKLNEAFSLPANLEQRKEEESQIIQRIYLMLPVLKEKAHFRELRENIKVFPLENRQLGKELFKSIPVMPWDTMEFFAKEGSKLIGHIEENALREADSFPPADKSFSKADYFSKEDYDSTANYVSVIEKVIFTLHTDYLDDFIIGLIKAKPIVLSSRVCFQALISRLENISNLSLILELIHTEVRTFYFKNSCSSEGHNHIFDVLIEKIDPFPESKRGLLLVRLASMIPYVTKNRIQASKSIVEKMNAATDDVSAISIRIQILAELASKLYIFKTSADLSTFLEVVEKNLPKIPSDQILLESHLPNNHIIPSDQMWEILGELAYSARSLTSEDLQGQVLDLLKRHLPRISDSQQIRSILSKLASCMDLKSETLQQDALDLLESYLRNNHIIPSDQMWKILDKLACSARSLMSEGLQGQVLDLLKHHLPRISDSQQIRSILSMLASSMDLKSVTLQQDALDLLESYLRNNHIIPSDQMWEILGELAYSARSLTSEDLQGQVLDLLKRHLPRISDSQQIRSILSKLASRMNLKSETLQQDALDLLKSYLPSDQILLESHLPNNHIIPSDQMWEILGELAYSARFLTSEDLQGQVLDLLKRHLPRISDSQQIRSILSKLASSMNLKSETLQQDALDLLKSYLPSDQILLESHLPSDQILLESHLPSDQILLESHLPNNHIIPSDQMWKILDKLACSASSLTSEGLQGQVLDLLKHHLPRISDSQQIRPILTNLASSMDLKSLTLQQDALNLLEENLIKISPGKKQAILDKLARKIRISSMPEAVRSGVVNCIMSNLRGIPNSQIGETLTGLALSMQHIESDDLKRSVFNFLEENLKGAFKNQAVLKNFLTIEQLSEILTIWAPGLANNADSKVSHFCNFPEQIKPNILEFFEKGMPYLSTEDISGVLRSFFWSRGIFLNKKEELSRVFSLTENYIDRLPDSERILIEVAYIFRLRNHEVSPEINYHFFTLCQKRLSSISADSVQLLLGTFTGSLRNLDDETRPHAIELLTQYIRDVTDPDVLRSMEYVDCKAVVNSYSSNTNPSKFRKAVEFFLFPFKMAWAFFISAFKFA